MEQQELLRIKNLRVSFPYGNQRIQVVRGFDLTVNEGEIVAVLGESGSGKSVSSLSILGLIESEDGQIDAGEVYYQGKDILQYPEKARRRLRGREISYILQNPVESLNPYRKVGAQIREILKIHQLPASREGILAAMRDVGLDNAETIYDMYPSQLSGGQCQRITIAMSLVCRPHLIIADESTSAIDASLQKKVLTLLQDINRKYGTSLIVITHDFDVAKYLCHKVIIMYGGLVMEQGNLEEVLASPRHPYTRELLACVNSLASGDRPLYALEGKTPSPTEFKPECPFYARCPKRHEYCLKSIPLLLEYRPGHLVRCLLT